MRMPPVLLLLPVLVLLGACTQTVPSAIATDDRPAFPQPAIASPVPAPLTIKSLAGTYKSPIDEQTIVEQLDQAKPLYTEEGGALNEEARKRLEIALRQSYELYLPQLKIFANGTFELLPNKLHGQVKLKSNKLILTVGGKKLLFTSTNNSAKPIIETDGTLNVSADGKQLLYIDPQRPSMLPRVLFVKR